MIGRGQVTVELAPLALGPALAAEHVAVGDDRVRAEAVERQFGFDGFVPSLEGNGIWIMWAFFLGWLALTWTAFIRRETELGIKVTRFEELLRYPLIVAIVAVSLLAFQGSGPIQTPEGTWWYPAKLILYAGALVIGLFLRLIMRRWTTRFRKLALGPDAAEEAALTPDQRCSGRNR